MFFFLFTLFFCRIFSGIFFLLCARSFVRSVIRRAAAAQQNHVIHNLLVVSLSVFVTSSTAHKSAHSAWWCDAALYFHEVRLFICWWCVVGVAVASVIHCRRRRRNTCTPHTSNVWRRCVIPYFRFYSRKQKNSLMEKWKNCCIFHSNGIWKKKTAINNSKSGMAWKWNMHGDIKVSFYEADWPPVSADASGKLKSQ